MSNTSIPNPWVRPLVLPTERPAVTMQQLTIYDAPDYYDSWSRSAADIARFDPETVGMFDSVEDVEDSIYQLGSLVMVTRDRDKFVGSGSLSPDKKTGMWLLGIWTDSRETSKGYGTLTARTLVRYAAGRFPLQAKVHNENTHSIHILEKTELERTGRNVGEFSIFELVQ